MKTAFAALNAAFEAVKKVSGVSNASLDGDHKSGEIIFEVEEDGAKWVLMMPLKLVSVDPIEPVVDPHDIIDHGLAAAMGNPGLSPLATRHPFDDDFTTEKESKPQKRKRK